MIAAVVMIALCLLWLCFIGYDAAEELTEIREQLERIATALEENDEEVDTLPGE